MKTKPIVPGCMAMIINSRIQSGKIVQVIKKSHKSPRFGQVWWLDQGILWIKKEKFVESEPKCPEYNLMRIDPDDDLKKQFETELRRENRVTRKVGSLKKKAIPKRVNTPVVTK